MLFKLFNLTSSGLLIIALYRNYRKYIPGRLLMFSPAPSPLNPAPHYLPPPIVTFLELNHYVHIAFYMTQQFNRRMALKFSAKK